MHVRIQGGGISSSSLPIEKRRPAFSVERIIDDELAAQDLVIGQLKRTKALSDPAKSFASGMWCGGMRSVASMAAAVFSCSLRMIIRPTRFAMALRQGRPNVDPSVAK